jgi:Ulp1 family protease
MKYIFIPIHHGNHYTCAVVSMEEMKVKYYDSLVSNKTRTRGCIGESLQTSILQVVLKYLKRMLLEYKGSTLPEGWILEPLCTAPQQNNDTDCVAFVCMFIDFVHDGCDFNFEINKIDVEDWEKRMILSIISNRAAVTKMMAVRMRLSF